MFEDWNETSGHFERDGLVGFRVKPIEASADAAFSAELIDATGQAVDGFYTTWNGTADVRLLRSEDHGILAVISMGRDDDYDDAPTDSPTFAWRVVDGVMHVVASKKWRDTRVAEALSIEWPDKSAFAALSGVQGWGE